MKIEEENLRLILKQEMKLALEQFKKFYLEANLTNELKEVQKLHARFFGSIKTSKKAKEKFKDY